LVPDSRFEKISLIITIYTKSAESSMPRFSTACCVEDSVPAVVYLALKYHDDPENALIVNTNLGGDNAARGAVLGALLGASHGVDQFPLAGLDVIAFVENPYIAVFSSCVGGADIT
jgi:ADP-ribosylglycohydrolase